MNRYSTRALLLGAIAVGALACGDGPQFPQVRDVRPTTVQMGDTMVIELDPTAQALEPGLPTRVRFEGDLTVIGADTSSASITLIGRAVGEHRVLVDADDYLSKAVGGRARMDASVVVLQQTEEDRAKAERDAKQQAREQGVLPASLLPDELDQAYAPIAISGKRSFSLNLFPGTTQKLGESAVGKEREQQFLDWLGLEVSLIRAGNGVKVTAVERGEGTNASPAHLGGLQPGDIITSVDGAQVASVSGLRTAWMSGEGNTVQLQVRRDSGMTTVRVAREGFPEHAPGGLLILALLIMGGLLIVAVVPVLGGIVVVWERKISGRMQSRPGPNRVGPNGWLQWLADGVKLIVKEDLTPSDADPVLFRISPLLVFSGVFLTFVVLPFSPFLNPADLNIGVLYLLSVTSLVVVGTIMGGWASNSKWSLLGGMRSAAQIISYELPASVAVLAVVIMVGSLSTQDVVRAQGGMPWEWHMFQNPFTFVCFFIFFISALAEGNRTPFDLPEAEQELVSGYNTEYSGFRFAIFALAEWVNMIVMGAIVAFIFMGGWNIPFVSPDQIEAGGFFSLLHLAAFLIFAAKVYAIIFVCIWIRWTLPRFRIDHMMTMCWKYFLPISLACMLGAAAWVWVVPEIGQLIVSLLVFAAGGLGVGVVFLKRVMYARRTTEVWDLRGA